MPVYELPGIGRKILRATPQANSLHEALVEAFQ
jgi:hypothetical protein